MDWPVPDQLHNLLDRVGPSLPSSP